MPILFDFWLIFALAIVPNNELTLLFMKKFKNVFEVKPNLFSKGRYFLCDGEHVKLVSKESVFCYVGSSVDAVELVLFFVFD